MSEPYYGEVRFFGFNFAPRNWSFCNGATLPISQNSALYALLGAQYGGDGRTNFQLPNLASRLPVGSGQGPGLTDRPNGRAFGTASVTLTTAQIPSHQHTFQSVFGRAVSTQPTPVAGGSIGPASSGSPFGTGGTNASMDPAAVSSTGGNEAHPNLPPTLGMNACIALLGIWPQRP